MGSKAEIMPTAYSSLAPWVFKRPDISSDFFSRASAAGRKP